MRKEGVVSLWAGVVDSRERLAELLEVDYDEEGDSIPARLAQGLGLPQYGYDTDLEESNVFEQQTTDLETLLQGHGFSLLVRTGSVITVFLHATGEREGFRGFGWGLPGGLTFESGREEAHSRLGQPVRSWSGGGKSALYDKEPAYDFFKLEGRVLYVQYRETRRSSWPPFPTPPPGSCVRPSTGSSPVFRCAIRRTRGKG